ncbi:MAG: hypothetical protein JWP78_3063 [Mucilaginibacter sp.]|nr:hypothetical protein [Mucilaginibacter sp.]
MHSRLIVFNLLIFKAITQNLQDKNDRNYHIPYI